MSRYKINIMEHQYYINTDRDPVSYTHLVIGAAIGRAVQQGAI